MLLNLLNTDRDRRAAETPRVLDDDRFPSDTAGHGAEEACAAPSSVRADREEAPRTPARIRIQDALWKAFVSPNGPYELFVNVELGGFSVVGPKGLPVAPWVQVPPCPAPSIEQSPKRSLPT